MVWLKKQKEFGLLHNTSFGKCECSLEGTLRKHSKEMVARANKRYTAVGQSIG